MSRGVDNRAVCEPGPGSPDRARLDELESELQLVRQRLADLVDRSPHASVIHSEGVIRYLNEAATKLFGSPERAVGTSLWEWVEQSSLPDVIGRVGCVINDGQLMAANETKLLRVDGSVFEAETMAGPTIWDGRPAVHVVLWDVSRRRRLEEELAWKAEHDPLTGLANRRLLTDRLQGLVKAGVSLAVLYLDLDKFKAINDHLGHDAGDELLRHVAQRLNARLKGGDILARVGGDEFVVIVPGVSRIGPARRVGRRLKMALDEPFDIRGRPERVGASVGVAVAAEGANNSSTRGASAAEVADELLRAADRDMFVAKRSRA